MRRGQGRPAGSGRLLLPRAAARRLWLAPILALGLAGCGDFDPAVVADHTTPAYQADLAACQKSGDAAADRLAKATFPMFALYPVSWPYEQRVQISRCMAAKGYKEQG